MSDSDAYVLWVAVAGVVLYLAGVAVALWCLALPFLGADPL